MLLFISSEFISQNLPSRDLINESGLIVLKNEESNDNILGSVYLHKEWSSTITLNTINNKTYKFSKANYNIALDKFVVKISKDTLLAIDNSKVKFILFDDNKFERINKKYYERLSEGNLNLLKEYDVEIKEGLKDAISKIKVTEDKYVIKSTYYIKTDDNLEKIKPNKRSFNKIFEEQNKKRVKKFMKQHSLSFKKDNDLKKILKYYNSL